MGSLKYLSKKELIFDALEEEILTGRLAPGTLLRQEELAERYGVSITPVREALRELSARGLVAHEVHRGVRVARAGVEGQDELAEIRTLLEPYAARLATSRVTAEDIDELKRINCCIEVTLGQTDLRDIRRLDYEFHMRLYGAAGTHHLLPMIRDAWAAHEWMRIVLPGRARQAVSEHAEIITALEARNVATVEKLMRAHLRGDATALHAERAKAPAGSGGRDGADPGGDDA